MMKLTNAVVDGVSAPIDFFSRERRQKREEVETAEEVARVRAEIKAGRLQMISIPKKSKLSQKIVPVTITPVKNVATAMASRTSAALVSLKKATPKAGKKPPALTRSGSSVDASASDIVAAANEDTDPSETFDHDFGFGRLILERHPSLTMPRLCVRLIKASVTNESIDKLLQCMETLLSRDQPFTLLVDVRHCCLPSRAQIRRAKDWSKTRETQLNKSLQGVVVLLSSSVVRATVNMVLSMQKPRQPTLVSTREEDCFAFARDQCTEVRVWTKDKKEKRGRKRADSGDSTADDTSSESASSRASSPTAEGAATESTWQDITVQPTLAGGTRGTLVPVSAPKTPRATGTTAPKTPRSVRIRSMMPKGQSRAEAVERDRAITYGGKPPLSDAALSMRRQRAREIAKRNASAPVAALGAASTGCSDALSRFWQRVSNTFVTEPESETMESATADALGFSSTKAVAAPAALSMLGRFY